MGNFTSTMHFFQIVPSTTWSSHFEWSSGEQNFHYLGASQVQLCLHPALQSGGLVGSGPLGSLSGLAGGYLSKVHMIVPSGNLLPKCYLWSFLSFVRPYTFGGRKTQVGTGLPRDPGSVGRWQPLLSLPSLFPSNHEWWDSLWTEFKACRKYHETVYPNDQSFLVFKDSTFSNIIPSNSKLEEGWHLSLGGK